MAEKPLGGGELQSEIDELKNEMQKANDLIGIKKVYQLDFPDNAFDSVPLLSIVKEIEKVKTEVKPQIIFTHHIGDMNIDHQLTHKAVLTATRPMADECVKQIYSMEIPSSTEWNNFNSQTAFIPNVFMDITETIDLKVKAMNEYVSELRDYPHPRSLQHIKELAKTNGTKVGLDYSENFILVRNVTKLNISILTDSTSWMNKYDSILKDEIEKLGHKVTITASKDDIYGGGKRHSFLSKLL